MQICRIGFGGPEPRPQPLQLSTDNCTGVIASAAEDLSQAKSISDGDQEYFYLYRISYAWYAMLGFAITVVVGWAASRGLDAVGACPAAECDDPSLMVDFLAKSAGDNELWLVGGKSNGSGALVGQDDDDEDDAKA